MESVKNVDPEEIRRKAQETREGQEKDLATRFAAKKVEQRECARHHCLQSLEDLNRTFSEFQNNIMPILPLSKCQNLAEVIGLFDTAILEATELIPSRKELAASE